MDNNLTVKRWLGRVFFSSFFGSNISLVFFQFFFSFLLLWLAYVLWWHADCKFWDWLFLSFFFPSLRRGDGTLKRVPSHVPVGVAEGSGSECQNGKPDPQPWSWETLWSSGWLLTTERGSQHGVGVVGEGHTRVLNNGWAAMCSPGLISFFFFVVLFFGEWGLAV